VEYERIPASNLGRFFSEHREDFSPQTVYRAKTLGRFDHRCQREFVDLGLMPVLEHEAGRAIERLLLDSVAELRDLLSWPKELDAERARWLVKAVFWLLGAKMLQDKSVEGFIRLAFSDVDEVFARVGRHYGESVEDLVTSQPKRRALEKVAAQIAASSSLRLTSSEALAYVYENALISDEVRAEFGTHSTPSYLVDYTIGRLAPWIQELKPHERSVFEPGCGHAAFLVAAVRHLTSLLPAEMAEPTARRAYLRQRVRGCDADDFALEIARLSLTLADIPNPNGWLLDKADVFASDILETAGKAATIVLANPRSKT
jgi:type I restriction-modification system DNA methylase subunit